MSAQLKDAAQTLFPEPGPQPDHVYGIALALVREGVGRLAWASARYKCGACRFEWDVWLSLGVEGPLGLRKNGLFIASPFATPCPAWPHFDPNDPGRMGDESKDPRCKGEMTHVIPGGDRQFEPTLVPDDVPRFVLPHAVFGGSEGAQIEIPTPALVAARKYHHNP